MEVGAKAVGHRLNTDPHPRPYSFRAHRRRSVELIVLPANRSKRLCLGIQFLRIERFSFLPNSQRNGGNLARQRQPRHLGAYPLLLETLKVTEVRLAPATAAPMNRSFNRRLQFRFRPRVATGFRLRTTRPALISYSELMYVTIARPL